MIQSYIARKALALHQKYHITYFPITLHILEQMISDYNVTIKNIRNLNRMCIIDNELLTPRCYDSEIAYRTSLAHELGHIILHCSNYFFESRNSKARIERQANVLASYILMPPHQFEKICSEDENIFALSEYFGVDYDLVSLRKELILADPEYTYAYNKSPELVL